MVRQPSSLLRASTHVQVANAKQAAAWAHHAQSKLSLLNSKLHGWQDERRRGRTVRELRFGDSPHCGHFRLHRDEYTRAIAAFLQEDLQATSTGRLLTCHIRKKHVVMQRMSASLLQSPHVMRTRLYMSAQSAQACMRGVTTAARE